jgi:hypothetical protein
LKPDAASRKNGSYAKVSVSHEVASMARTLHAARLPNPLNLQSSVPSTHKACQPPRLNGMSKAALRLFRSR